MARIYQAWEGAEAAASKLFDKALFMKVEHNGPSITDKAAFRILPSVVESHGISMEKLMDAESRRLGANREDLAAYHVINALEQLIRTGFVYLSRYSNGDQKVFPTTKSAGLFYLLENPQRLSAWMAERRAKAESQGMDLFKFDVNAQSVRNIIEEMLSSRNGASLKETARQ